MRFIAANQLISFRDIQLTIYQQIFSLIYFIDGVLLPPWTGISIFATARGNNDLSTLVSLIDLCNLTGLLSGMEGPFTLLAPNNTALSQWNSLSAASNVTFVRETLLGHILVGNWYASDVNETLVSLNNRTWTMRKVGVDVHVGGARASQSNILASNGVVHVIDQVLTENSTL